jgi:heterodisulfide reductase subunit B
MTKSEALEKSIEKWRTVWGSGGVDRGINNCALCQMFWDNQRCDGCPVAERAQATFCVDTPYAEWDDHNADIHNTVVTRKVGYRVHTGCKQCAELSFAEYRFIKSLKEDG